MLGGKLRQFAGLSAADQEALRRNSPTHVAVSEPAITVAVLAREVQQEKDSSPGIQFCAKTPVGGFGTFEVQLVLGDAFHFGRYLLAHGPRRLCKSVPYIREVS